MLYLFGCVSSCLYSCSEGTSPVRRTGERSVFPKETLEPRGTCCCFSEGKTGSDGNKRDRLTRTNNGTDFVYGPIYKNH